MKTGSMLTTDMQRKRRKHMHNTNPAPQSALSEPGWSKAQGRFLAVLAYEEHRTKTTTEICQLAGYATTYPWYQALKDERFADVVHTFGIKRKRSYNRWTEVQQRLLGILQQEENRRKS